MSRKKDDETDDEPTGICKTPFHIGRQWQKILDDEEAGVEEEPDLLPPGYDPSKAKVWPETAIGAAMRRRFEAGQAKTAEQKAREAEDDGFGHMIDGPLSESKA